MAKLRTIDPLGIMKLSKSLGKAILEVYCLKSTEPQHFQDIINHTSIFSKSYLGGLGR